MGDAMKNAADMIKGMSPEQLAEMQAQAAKMHGVNAPNISPEQAKMAAEMMGKMSPEDMDRMMEMQKQMGKGGAGAPGAMPDPATMAKMMEKMDPEMLTK